MVVETSTVAIVDATENEPILLNTVHSNIGEIDETYSHFSIGTVQSEVEEKGSYILTIYRDGNIDSEATVDLVSADISAKYGKDYIVEDMGIDSYFILADERLTIEAAMNYFENNRKLLIILITKDAKDTGKPLSIIAYPDIIDMKKILDVY